jgi:hypothetical protein
LQGAKGVGYGLGGGVLGGVSKGLGHVADAVGTPVGRAVSPYLHGFGDNLQASSAEGWKDVPNALHNIGTLRGHSAVRGVDAWDQAQAAELDRRGQFGGSVVRGANAVGNAAGQAALGGIAGGAAVSGARAALPAGRVASGLTPAAEAASAGSSTTAGAAGGVGARGLLGVAGPVALGGSMIGPGLLERNAPETSAWLGDQIANWTAPFNRGAQNMPDKIQFDMAKARLGQPNSRAVIEGMEPAARQQEINRLYGMVQPYLAKTQSELASAMPAPGTKGFTPTLDMLTGGSIAGQQASAAGQSAAKVQPGTVSGQGEGHPGNTIFGIPSDQAGYGLGLLGLLSLLGGGGGSSTLPLLLMLLGSGAVAHGAGAFNGVGASGGAAKGPQGQVPAPQQQPIDLKKALPLLGRIAGGRRDAEAERGLLDVMGDRVPFDERALFTPGQAVDYMTGGHSVADRILGRARGMAGDFGLEPAQYDALIKSLSEQGSAGQP